MDTLWSVLAESSVQSVVLVADAVMFTLTAHCLKRCSNTLKALAEAKIFDSPAGIAELAASSDKNHSYAVVRGPIVALSDPIRSPNNPKVEGVIQKLSIKEHVVRRVGGGFWSNQERIINEAFNTVPFAVTGTNVKIEIVEPLKADILDLEVIMDKFQPQPSGFFDYFWGFFSGIRQRGLQTTEEMLRTGTLVTAVGELMDERGQLKLIPPQNGLPSYLTTSTKLNLVKHLEESKTFFKIAIFVLGSAAICISTNILIKFVKKRRKIRAEEALKRQLENNRKARRATNRDRHLGEVQLCVVCSENPKEIVLLPCGHVSLCEDCSDKIEENCPICRTPIESRAAVFM